MFRMATSTFSSFLRKTQSNLRATARLGKRDAAAQETEENGGGDDVDPERCGRALAFKHEILFRNRKCVDNIVTAFRMDVGKVGGGAQAFHSWRGLDGIDRRAGRLMWFETSTQGVTFETLNWGGDAPIGVGAILPLPAWLGIRPRFTTGMLFPNLSI